MNCTCSLNKTTLDTFGCDEEGGVTAFAENKDAASSSSETITSSLISVLT